MSCAKNTPRDDEECEGEKTVEVGSPYHNEIESFDNEESYPDMEFVLGRGSKPLLLHRKIIANASGWFKKNLNDKWGQRVEWPFDTNNDIDKEAVLKTLRYCYGETMTVGTKNGECFALISTLTRLQVTCLDDVVMTLNKFIVEEAKRRIETGVELLKMCSQCTVCCGTNQSSLNHTLASVVLTKENMSEHYKEVVDECLMMLPPEYLTMAEFGEPHTKLSEFCLKAKYVRLHSKELSIESQHGMIVNCDWSTLSSQELRELRMTKIADTDELLEAHEKALELCEAKIGEANETLRMREDMEEKVKIAEKERDEAVEKIKRVGSERDVYQRSLEKKNSSIRKVVKEREEEKKWRKKAETERDECQGHLRKSENLISEMKKEKEMRVKEMGELKRCLEKSEQEKEEEKKKRKKAETEREDFRRRAEKSEKEKKEKMKEIEMMRKQSTQTERERDSKAKEVEELKKRLEDAENEREKHLSRVDGLEKTTKENCLFFFNQDNLTKMLFISGRSNDRQHVDIIVSESNESTLVSVHESSLKHRMPEVIERQVTKSLEEWKRKDEEALELSGLTFKHRH